MIKLYDPRTNVITTTTYEYLEKLTGQPKSSLMSYRSKGKKLQKINSYILKDDTTLKQRKEWYSKEKYADEHWVTIIGSDGKSLLSNYGRIKRVHKKTASFILPYLKKRTGYLEAKVMFNHQYKAYKIDKLVAAHFIGTPKENEVLQHKNGIKTDNFAGNLGFIEKAKLAKKTGPMSGSKAVIQFDKETMEIIGEFRSAREAGRKCYLSYQAVLDCCNGKSKTSGGFIFKFAEEEEKAS